MRALLAFDKFKDALSAPQACALAAGSLRARQPDWTLDLCPLTDGGEGFCEILTQALGGTFEAHTVTGPRGEPVVARLGFVPLALIPATARRLLDLPDSQLSALNSQLPRDARVAVVEMAAASGLALLAPEARDPWLTSTTGTGELIRLAARPGVAAILLGLGGSATSDLGLGALAALGLNFVSAAGELIDPPIPSRWPEITRLDGRLPADLPPLRIACDVANPLLGPNGAAAIYGPQKGLRPADLRRLDNEAARLALLLCTHSAKPDTLMDVPGAGAAGGISFGLMAAASAQLISGFDLVSAWLDLDSRLAAADLVLTGEGRFDASSLSGKGPGALAARAAALGKPVHVFAGAITAAPVPGLALHAITPPGTPLPAALRAAATNLTATVDRTFGPASPSGSTA
ncbi:MAG: glycerate kinase [Verrucomicrobia bacterium]|nr:glycerate kinase [Verrucomicrobiota bacterium]